MHTMGQSFEDYVRSQRANLDHMLRFEPFATTILPLHEIYTSAIHLIPADNFYGQFVLMAHKEFLAAASLIGQAQPDEAAPITRRAIEMIRVAQAVKQDPENTKKWIAFEERIERWRVRREGKKPKSIRINLKVSHPIIDQLMAIHGMLSDSGAHFTPEHFASRNWSKRDGMLYLDYFNGDQRTIEREILLLVAVHTLILRVLDGCLEGAFSKYEKWAQSLAQLQKRAKQLSAKFEPRTEEDLPVP